MNKTTCKVCGYVFELTKKRHYIAREKTELFLLPSNKMEPTLYDAFDCPHICVENPVSSRIYKMPPCSQEVQPYMFGHPVKKKTRLWLKGLPPLKPTNIVDPKCGCHEAGTWFMVGGKDRQKNRAKTFPGLAKAMAEQLGRLLPPEGEKNNG